MRATRTRGARTVLRDVSRESAGDGGGFGPLLRRYRLAAGLTQEGLAERAGLSREAISALERGSRQAPYRATVAVLAEALRLDADRRAVLEQAVARALGGEGNYPPARLVPPRPPDLARHNLPAEVTSFVGRERERAEVKERLAASRLLSLTGSGGCGKTRLALRVAAEVLDAYPDGVWLVDLAPLADPSLVPAAVAGVLDVREAPGRPPLAALVDALRGRDLLLVLDNCEHLVDACARLAEALLRGCPAVRVLATSREVLGVPGEATWLVPSLPVPTPETAEVEDYAAVRLFVDRARAVAPTFGLTARNGPAVAAICRRLDGIPLAIELATARVRVLAPEQIAARLDDRFRLLSGGSRTALRRHQTLRAVVDWSFDLLTDAERVLLRRLAVFAGGWTLEAAEAVCGDAEDRGQGGEGGAALTPDDVLDLLTELVDKSLVLVEGQGEHSRYSFLETMRQYAGERLVEAGEAEPIGRRHAEAYLALAVAAEAELRGPRQVAWLDRLDREHDNLRAALAWLAARDRWVDALRLAAGLHLFWLVRGHYREGRTRLAEGLARVEVSREPSLCAEGYLALSYLATRQGDYPQARRYRDTFFSIATGAGDRRLIVRALGGWIPKPDIFAETAAIAPWEDALAEARELGLAAEEGTILIDLGLARFNLGDHAGAAAHTAEGLARLRQVGDAARLAFGLNLACAMAADRGDFRSARPLAEEYRQLAEALGDRSGRANCAFRLGEVACWEGELATARAYLAEALASYRDVDDRYGVAMAAAELSRVHLRQGDLVGAAALAEECLALARNTVEEESLLVRVLRAAGDVALGRGEVQAAAARYQEGLAGLGRKLHGEQCVTIVEGLARTAAAQGRARRALRLAGAAAAERARLGAETAAIERGWTEAALGCARASLGDAESGAAWTEGQAMTMEQAVAYALDEEVP